MELLFTENENGQISDDFKSYYSAINKDTSFKKLKPYIKGATASYLIPFLDKTFYKALIDEASKKEAEQNEVLTEIIDHLKMSLAYYTVYDAYPHLDSVIANAGHKSNEPEYSSPVSQWRYKSERWNALAKADLFLDLALQVIEEETTNATVLALKDSTNYKRNTSQLFKTTKDLSEYISIHGRRAYISLVPYLKEAERRARKLLCSEADLLDSAPDSAEVSQLIELVKHWVARKAIFEGMPHLNLLFDGSGYKLVSSTDSFDTRSNNFLISKIAWEKMRPTIKVQYEEYEAEIKQTLIKDKTTFARYFQENQRTSSGPKVYPGNGCGGVMMGK